MGVPRWSGDLQGNSGVRSGRAPRVAWSGRASRVVCHCQACHCQEAARDRGNGRQITVRRQGAIEGKGDRGGERCDVSDPSNVQGPLEKGSEAKRREIRRQRETLERSSS